MTAPEVSTDWKRIMRRHDCDADRVIAAEGLPTVGPIRDLVAFACMHERYSVVTKATNFTVPQRLDWPTLAACAIYLGISAERLDRDLREWDGTPNYNACSVRTRIGTVCAQGAVSDQYGWPMCWQHSQKFERLALWYIAELHRGELSELFERLSYRVSEGLRLDDQEAEHKVACRILDLCDDLLRENGREALQAGLEDLWSA